MKRRSLPRTADRAASLVRRELEGVAARDRPVVVGPWLSEVGFELLYWIPFLRWAVRELELTGDRVIAVSRGGVGSWYDGIASSYGEIFDGMSAEEFHQRTQERWDRAGGQKHLDAGKLDRLALAAAGVDPSAHVIHPGTMYRLFRPFWLGNAGLRHVQDHMQPSRLAAPDDAILESLPAEFVAVRWYFRPSFPDTAENRSFAARITEQLARTTSVVLLNTGLELDEHRELLPAGRAFPRPLLGVQAAQNLRLQSAIVARATMLVGTYGGLSYLAPFYGRPSVGIASHPEHVVPAHLEWGRAAARATGGSLTVCDPSTFESIRRGDGLQPS